LKNVHTGNYTVKLGYITILEEEFSRKQKWWWSEVSDLNAPFENENYFLVITQKQYLDMG
jgi:hypothetical protein